MDSFMAYKWMAIPAFRVGSPAPPSVFHPWMKSTCSSDFGSGMGFHRICCGVRCWFVKSFTIYCDEAWRSYWWCTTEGKIRYNQLGQNRIVRFTWIDKLWDWRINLPRLRTFVDYDFSGPWMPSRIIVHSTCCRDIFVDCSESRVTHWVKPRSWSDFQNLEDTTSRPTYFWP